MSHSDRLRLMAAIDDLLLPWTVDLALRHEIPAELNAHVQRVGRCLWQRHRVSRPQSLLQKTRSLKGRWRQWKALHRHQPRGLLGL